jgi:hypothetical protein
VLRPARQSWAQLSFAKNYGQVSGEVFLTRLLKQSRSVQESLSMAKTQNWLARVFGQASLE